ncbi:MAG: hypothetical protein ACE37H_01585 [Phycisphaeraceae bacterium]
MLVAGVVLGVLLGPAVLGRLAPDAYDRLFEGTGDLGRVQDARAELEKLDTGEIDFTQSEQATAAFEAFDRANQLRQKRIEAIRKQYERVGEEDDSTAIARDEQIRSVEAEEEQDLATLRLRLINVKQDMRERLLIELVRAEREVNDQQDAHRAKLMGMATAMLLLIVLLLTAEAILSPQRREIEEGKAELPPVLSRLITVRYALAAGWLMLMLAQPVWLRGIDLWFGGLLLLVVLVAGLVPLGRRA